MNPQPVPPIVLDDAFPIWFDVLTFAPVIVVLLVSLYFLRQGVSGFGFMKKQSDFLDHQKDASNKALEQSKAFEDMIAKQYADANLRTDRALAQSEEAIRLHSAALEQLARLNATLDKVASRLETSGGRNLPGPSAS